MLTKSSVWSIYFDTYRRAVASGVDRAEADRIASDAMQAKIDRIGGPDAWVELPK